jgi:hypothetical protein
MLDPVYDKSARIYDLLYTGIGIKDYAAEAEELRRIIMGACPAAHTLLDVACGTTTTAPVRTSPVMTR